MRSGETWYEILEISSDATTEEIRQAYFEQARQYHPDTNPGELAREWFYQVQEAYETLSDPSRRKQYDESIKGRKNLKDLAALECTYSTDAIPRLDESQVIYLMMDLKSLMDVEKSKPPQVHLCLVIDRSTSMKGARIDMVKENVMRLKENLKPSDLISIVAFNDKADLVLTPTRIDSINQLDEKLAQVQCFGGTEMYKGLKAGFDLLWGSHSAGTIKHILLLTDGHTYGDEDACFDLAQKLQSRGIMLSTLGIGHEWNDAFLDKLAGLTGGCSTFISKPEDLHNFVSELGSSVSVIVANALTLDFQSDDNVTPNFLFRLQPTISELPMTKPIPLGDLYSNKKSTFLISITVPPCKKEQQTVTLIKGKIRMEAAANLNRKTKIFVNLSLPVKGRTINDNPPKEILEALSKITIYQMQQKANEDVKDGNIDAAIDRLGRISTQLFKHGHPEMAQKTLREAESLKRNQKYSTDGEKQLKYGTRALLAPEVEKREP